MIVYVVTDRWAAPNGRMSGRILGIFQYYREAKDLFDGPRAADHWRQMERSLVTFKNKLDKCKEKEQTN